MKKIAIAVIAFFIFNSQSFANTNRFDNFYFKPALTIEYQAPHISGGGANSNLKTNNFGKQITNFENIAIGGFVKFSPRIGVNLNWVKTNLHNSELKGVALSQVARFNIEHINLSGVYLVEVIDNFAEFFGEAGVSSMKSNLKYVDSNLNSVKKTNNELMPFIGAGFQIKPFKSPSNALRFSVQRYCCKIDLIDSPYTTVRVGFVKYF